MLTNWLGKWFGGWFGASAPSSPGAMSGAATVGIAASAGLTASGVMSGAAALSISSSGSIGVSLPGADDCWGASWGGTWGVSWGFIEVPYQELSLKGQVFVRSYLSSIHSVEVAEQIVSVAALNNISVIDAEVVVAARQGETRVEAVKKRMPSRIQPQEQAKQPERKKQLDLTVLYSQKAVFAEQHRASISAEATQARLVAYHNAMRADLINYAYL